jgi:hypothetical protein
MKSRVFAQISLLLLSSAAICQTKQAADGPPLSGQTRIQLIRLLNAEFAFTRTPLPQGEKGITIKSNGELSPNPQQMSWISANNGLTARPGERVQITDILFKDKTVAFEINGGPKKKLKWYQHISIAGMGGETPIAPASSEIPHGSVILVEFKHRVPEMTLADMKEILKPVLDFTVKSAAEAYTDTLPENVRNAIRDHKVLVGMSKEMVTFAKGRPPQRVREKDDHGADYEEWIYGTPPNDVEFVRFVGDEVSQLKVMRVDGEKIVKTEREVQLDRNGTVMQQTAQSSIPTTADPGNQQGTTQTASDKKRSAPSLRRPGEAPVQPDYDPAVQKVPVGIPLPGPTPPEQPPPESPR